MPKAVTPPPAMMVLFDLNSAKLSGNAPNQVTHAAVLASGKDQLFTIHLAGHTDLAGDAKYNLVLSKARVDAVAEALIKAGVPANRITKEIYGEEKPRVMTADGKPEQANRRVEAVFRK
jgi:outer membrane protein OmpA-like peptidoglycan-associated protein